MIMFRPRRYPSYPTLPPLLEQTDQSDNKPQQRDHALEVRTAYLAKRDAAVAAALAQIGSSAPAALADAGRYAQQADEVRQAHLRSQGPSGIRKAELEMAYRNGLAARAELDAIETEEIRAAQEADRAAVARAARLPYRMVDFMRRKFRR